MTSAFAKADAVYAAANARGVRERLQHPILERLHKAVRELSRLAAEAEDELAWGEVTRRLRRYCFLSTATPLAFDHPLLWEAKMEAAIRRAQVVGSVSYPEFSPTVETIAETLAALQAEPANPLWHAILDYGTPRRATGSTRDEYALLLADSRAVAAVEALARSVPRLNVVTSHQLQDDGAYAGMIVLGTTRWFPDSCFTAPRAREIRLLQFAWVQDNTRFQTAFLPNRQDPTFTFLHENKTDPLSTAETFEVPMPSLDWTSVLRLGSASTGGEVDDVAAHVWALGGQQGVWMEDSAQASVLTLNLPTGGNTSTPRVSMRNLSPGMFILLRSEGGGDLIVPVADRILERERARVRGLQAEWKRALQLEVSRYGSLAYTGQRLTRLGSVRPHPQNIRNWMSMRNICPDDPADFQAVLKLCGLEQRFPEFSAGMEQIEKAHRVAGHRISQMILDAVARADTTPLRRGGVQVFELPQGEGGSFTAYRLLERSPTTALVPAHRLHDVFPMED